MNNMTGAGWATLGALGKETRQFNDPEAVFVDADRRIYVAERGNNRIVRMDDMTGAGWTVLGAPEQGIKEFYFPASIFVRWSESGGHHSIINVAVPIVPSRRVPSLKTEAPALNHIPTWPHRAVLRNTPFLAEDRSHHRVSCYRLATGPRGSGHHGRTGDDTRPLGKGWEMRATSQGSRARQGPDLNRTQEVGGSNPLVSTI